MLTVEILQKNYICRGSKSNIMKYLRILGILIVIVIAIVILLSLFMPTQQQVIRSIMIDAPATKVYDQLIKLENFNKWSVWNLRDSSVKLTITGKDATVGASSSWTGNPEISGMGKIQIASLEPGKKIVHLIEFTHPNKGTAESEFKLEEVSGGTKLTWEFDLETPRPKNIFNLFYSMEKKMGKDFEEGLLLIKTAIEMKTQLKTTKTYDIKAMNFPTTRFAFVRQEVKKDDIPAFFDQHIPLIIEELKKMNSAGGQSYALIYGWDQEKDVADLAAAVSIPADIKIDNAVVQTTEITASKSLFTTYYGAYSGIMEAYTSIDKYISTNNLKKKPPFIEKYVTGPFNEKDPTKWETKVIYLVE